MRHSAATTCLDQAVGFEFPTTAGVIAMANLQAQIDGQRWQATGGLDVSAQAGLIELIALRGHVLGCIADYELAETLAEQLTQNASSDGDAFLAHARARATFHRFTDALTDLDKAQRLGADLAKVDAERAAIFQATGQYEPALKIYSEAWERRADFNSLGDLATLYAEREEITAAERLFSESQALYRGVSPIPLAQLEFKRAHMWIAQNDLERARTWLEAAVRRLPQYAVAQGHLAEVEAAMGETDSAIARLRQLTISSDDPDYATQLARILREAGRFDEVSEWRERARNRYDELVARHLEAFADHAAYFWLGVGANPRRALWLAKKNHEVRPTRRAEKLVERATIAVDLAREKDSMIHPTRRADGLNNSSQPCG